MIRFYAQKEAGGNLYLFDPAQLVANETTHELIVAMEISLRLMVVADMGWTGIAFSHPNGSGIVAMDDSTPYNYEKIVDCTEQLLKSMIKNQ